MACMCVWAYLCAGVRACVHARLDIQHFKYLTKQDIILLQT
jgi:hypothetical protein